MEEPGPSARKTHIPNNTQGLMPQRYFLILKRGGLIREQ